MAFLAALAALLIFAVGTLWYLGRCTHQYVKVDSGVVHEYFMGEWFRDRHWSLHQCSKCGKYAKREVRV